MNSIPLNISDIKTSRRNVPIQYVYDVYTHRLCIYGFTAVRLCNLRYSLIVVPRNNTHTRTHRPFENCAYGFTQNLYVLSLQALRVTLNKISRVIFTICIRKLLQIIKIYTSLGSRNYHKNGNTRTSNIILSKMMKNTTKYAIIRISTINVGFFHQYCNFTSAFTFVHSFGRFRVKT